MYIQYQDLCIRNATSKDYPKLLKWWNDGKVMAHAGFPLGLNTTIEEIAESISKDQDDTRRRLIIDYKDISIGEMSYHNCNDGKVEIGIKICNFDYQEKGLGRKLLSMFIEELFNMGYTKIILDTNLNNTRAQHVYELLGFKKVGVRIDTWEDQLGQLQSAVDYELVLDDFHNYCKE